MLASILAYLSGQNLTTLGAGVVSYIGQPQNLPLASLTMRLMGFESEMKILDLFCGAGGAAMGYSQACQDAGIECEITGVDIKPMPRYPFRFILADAMTYPLDGYDFIHASPPCQAYVDSANKSKHPRLIEPTRERLMAAGVPYVIENVDCAPLFNPLLLCGTMFGLRVIRHRLFESNRPVYFPPATCAHWGKVQDGTFAGVYGRGARGARYVDKFGRRNRWGSVPEGAKLLDFWRRAMGIDWMSREELTQAIPPAYTKFLGGQLLHHIMQGRNEMNERLGV